MSFDEKSAVAQNHSLSPAQCSGSWTIVRAVHERGLFASDISQKEKLKEFRQRATAEKTEPNQRDPQVRAAESQRLRYNACGQKFAL